MENPLEPLPPPVTPAPTFSRNVVAYYPPPAYPPPGYGMGKTNDSRAMTSVALGILGILFGLPIGVPGMVFGPIAYFFGKGAKARIDASSGALGGRSLATSGTVLGVVATAIGAVVTLIWLVLVLVAISTPTS